MDIIKNFIPISKYSRPGITLKKIAKIAVHYTGGAGGTAAGVRSWFETVGKGYKNGNSYTYASSHYVIGLEGEIIQMIPEDEISYATNSANSYSISIENCHPKTDGKFNDKTYNSLVDLCVDLCRRYNLDPQKDIIRHYDVTGKKCPLYWVNHPDDFLKFKTEVQNKMNGITPIETVKMNIDGKEYCFNRILKDDVNFVKIADFNKAGYKVAYDTKNKTVSISKKPEKIEVLVNGRNYEINRILVNGENYIKLRDLEKCGVTIGYNVGKKQPKLIF